MKTARYWHLRDDGLIECDLCPRHCHIADGKHGTCLVRQRKGNELIAASYGLISGLAVDPIEKKPLYHFLPGSSALSFVTVGCNMLCGFCQNHHLSRATRLEGSRTTPEEIAEAAIRYGCESVAFTYNEPVVFAEQALEVAAACRAEGVRTVAVTAGLLNVLSKKEPTHES